MKKQLPPIHCFIVGFAALVGGINQNRNNNVDWRTAIVFGIPSLIGVWIVRHYVIPVLPDTLFYIGGLLNYEKDGYVWSFL